MKIRILFIFVVFFIITASLASGNFINLSKINNENISAEISSQDDGFISKKALIIGTDEFVYSDKDAIELEETLLSTGWDKSNIKTLIGDEASKDNITSSLDYLAEQEDSSDTVLFYFSGHGDEGCIYSYDDRVITVVDLDEKFDNFESQKLILIFDCCFSGSLDEKQKEGQTNLIIKGGKSNDKDYDPYGGLAQFGRIILTASNSSGYSYADTYLENGFFSYYLIEALSGSYDSDSNGDGWISIIEAFNYAKPRTIEYSDNLQYPQFYNGCFKDIKVTKIGGINSVDRVKISNLFARFTNLYFALKYMHGLIRI